MAQGGIVERRRQSKGSQRVMAGSLPWGSLGLSLPWTWMSPTLLTLLELSLMLIAWMSWYSQLLMLLAP